MKNEQRAHRPTRDASETEWTKARATSIIYFMRIPHCADIPNVRPTHLGNPINMYIRNLSSYPNARWPQRHVQTAHQQYVLIIPAHMHAQFNKVCGFGWHDGAAPRRWVRYYAAVIVVTMFGVNITINGSVTRSAWFNCEQFRTIIKSTRSIYHTSNRNNWF